jgi:hypothetical protein
VDLTEVEKAVAEGNGFAAVSVRALRDAHGAARAKVHVVAGISAALRGAGYGHIPVEIPKDEKRSVIVFRRLEQGVTGAGAGAVVMSKIESLCLGGEQSDSAAFALAIMAPFLRIGAELAMEASRAE